jgi:hypothetical protein
MRELPAQQDRREFCLALAVQHIAKTSIELSLLVHLGSHPNCRNGARWAERATASRAC